MTPAQILLSLGLVAGLALYVWTWRRVRLDNAVAWRAWAFLFIAWGILPALLMYFAWLPPADLNVTLVLIYFSAFVVGAPLSLMWRRLGAHDA